MALGGDWYLRSRLKLRHLKLLVVLADVGNQAEAARRLATTQPGASKMLAELEAMVGARLFERTAKGALPTPQGEILIRHARWILGDLGRLGDELEASGDQLAGELRLGTNSSSAACLVPRSLVLLRQLAPALTVAVHEESVESLLPALEARRLDLVVARLGRATAGAAYTQVELIDEPMVLAVAPNHPLTARKRALRWRDLDDYPWILPPEGSPVHDALILLLDRHRVDPRVLARSASILNNLALMETAGALGIFPAAVGREYQRRGLLAALPLALPPVFGPIGVITLRGLAPSPALAAMIRCLQSSARELKASAPVI
jgi:DNA-binding transcriptional LysR family regulator